MSQFKFTSALFFKKVFLLSLLIGLCGALWYFFVIRPQQTTDLTFYGNVDIRQVNVAFRVNGRLEEMFFEEGDRVKKGDLLAKLDPEPIQNNLNQAQAQLKQAKVEAENASIKQNRRLPLCKSGTISVQECDDLLMEKNKTEATVLYMDSLLDEAKTALNDTFLYAPSDGIILIRILEPGTILSAGLPVYSISLNEKMWVRTYIQETDLGRIKIGTPVSVLTDSTDKIYKGRVGFISPQAEFTPKNIETGTLRTDLVYRTRIIIDNPDDYLKQGMPVTIKALPK